MAFDKMGEWKMLMKNFEMCLGLLEHWTEGGERERIRGEGDSTKEFLVGEWQAEQYEKNKEEDLLGWLP